MSTKVLPSVRLFNEFQEKILAGQMSLTDLVRHGARTKIQYAVELEVSQFLGREYYRNDPATTATRGRRNGYEPHTVLTGDGAIDIELPQIRDVPEGSEKFRSKILEAYGSRTETLDEIICKMYVLGMSTRDIKSAFATVRLRTNKTKGCGSRTACLTMVFKLDQCAENHWRILTGSPLLDEVIRGIKFMDGIKEIAA